jgi:hypothetical protein
MAFAREIMLALPLLSLSAAAPASPSADQLAQIFVGACLDGQISLSGIEASRVSTLPPELQEKLGTPISANVWRLETGEPSFLYVLEFKPGGRHDTKICGLASPTMSVRAATDAVDQRATGSVGENGVQGTQWLMPKDGYVATVTKTGDYTVAQVNWLSDRVRASLLKQVGQVGP